MVMKKLKFHISSSDYFGTLATLLSLNGQIFKNNKKQILIINDIIKDLLYLQKNCKIIFNKKRR